MNFVAKKRRLRKRAPYIEEKDLRIARHEILFGENLEKYEIPNSEIDDLLESNFMHGSISKNTYEEIKDMIDEE